MIFSGRRRRLAMLDVARASAPTPSLMRSLVRLAIEGNATPSSTPRTRIRWCVMRRIREVTDSGADIVIDPVRHPDERASAACRGGPAVSSARPINPTLPANQVLLRRSVLGVDWKWALGHHGTRAPGRPRPGRHSAPRPVRPTWSPWKARVPLAGPIRRRVVGKCALSHPLSAPTLPTHPSPFCSLDQRCVVSNRLSKRQEGDHLRSGAPAGVTLASVAAGPNVHRDLAAIRGHDAPWPSTITSRKPLRP